MEWITSVKEFFMDPQVQRFALAMGMAFCVWFVLMLGIKGTVGDYTHYRKKF